MVANDPHLSLPSPSTFYEAGIDVDGGRHEDDLALYGVTFPGAPTIVQGTNGHVSWGSTVNPTDVTDVYQEQLTLAGGVPVATTYRGSPEPTQIIPETFRANQPGNGTLDDVGVIPPAAGVPAASIVVPRRNNGPLISVSGTTGLSVQYTGFSATRELDFFRKLTRADDVGEAIDAQRYFDVGAQNWMYADDRGNIGYKTSAVRAVPVGVVGKGCYDASFDNTYSRKYPLARGLYIYLLKDPKKPMDTLSGEFVKYVLSRDGQMQAKKGGYYPITRNIREHELTRLGLLASAN